VSLQIGLGASQTGNVDATFDLAGFNQQVSGLFNASPIDNGRVVTNSAATPSTLTVNNASSPYTFDGVIAGHVALVKAGNGTQTLAGTNTTSGGVTVNAGTLVVGANGTLGVNCTNIVVAAGTLALSNSVSLADTAALRIANGGGAKVSLAAGVDEAVGTLWFGDKQRPGGTYGASGSGASVTDDVHFAGGGKLTVLHGNGGTRIWLN
jgi:autotransporter-associated beta strand protein